MPNSNAKKVLSYQSLNRLLGAKFVIFCGSAVSLGIKRNDQELIKFLPMVYEVSEKFYSKLGESLDQTIYIGKLLSHYSAHISQGKFRKGRENRKFEEFLWLLEQSLNTKIIAKLISSLYECENNQFLPNHTAIGKLMVEGRVKLCLTTNFDNAIELADPRIRPLVHTKKFTIHNIPNRPTLIKLHGDVIKGNYIATTPNLLYAEKEGQFSYLENLLENQTVLVVGYSARGDTDISPQLIKMRDRGTKLIWIVRPGLEPPVDIATHWFESDLTSLNNENCLIKLAKLSTKDITNSISSPPWVTRLEKWIFNNIDIPTARQIIDQSLDLISGWPKFRLYYVNKWEKISSSKAEDKISDLTYFYEKCLGVGTYYSALRRLRKIDLIALKQTSVDVYENFLKKKAFCYWRLVRLTEARDILEYFIKQNKTGGKRSNDEEGIRSYLEVTRDILASLVSLDAAQKYFIQYNLDRVCNTLLLLASKTTDPGSELLAKLVVLDINYQAGKQITLEDYQFVYQRAIDLQIWFIARNAARSIIRINTREGMKRLSQLSDKVGFWTWHTFKHTLLSIIDRLPKIFISPYHVLNIILTGIPAYEREIELRIRIFFWWLKYQIKAN